MSYGLCANSFKIVILNSYNLKKNVNNYSSMFFVLFNTNLWGYVECFNDCS